VSKYCSSNCNWLISFVAAFLFFISTNVASNSPKDNTKIPTSDVGSLKGNFQVTPTGQARYSIPIDASPGTAGITIATIPKDEPLFQLTTNQKQYLSNHIKTESREA
jgi:hypothetical protein